MCVSFSLAYQADASKTSIFCFRKHVRNFHPQPSLTVISVISLRRLKHLPQPQEQKHLLVSDSPFLLCPSCPKGHQWLQWLPQSSECPLLLQFYLVFWSTTAYLALAVLLAVPIHLASLTTRSWRVPSFALNRSPTQAFSLARRPSNRSPSCLCPRPKQSSKKLNRAQGPATLSPTLGPSQHWGLPAISSQCHGTPNGWQARPVGCLALPGSFLSVPLLWPYFPLPSYRVLIPIISFSL